MKHVTTTISPGYFVLFPDDCCSSGREKRTEGVASRQGRMCTHDCVNRERGMMNHSKSLGEVRRLVALRCSRKQGDGSIERQTSS